MWEKSFDTHKMDFLMDVHPYFVNVCKDYIDLDVIVSLRQPSFAITYESNWSDEKMTWKPT